VPDQAAATGQAAAMALELEVGSDQGWDPAQLLGWAQGRGLGLPPALLLQLLLLVLL